MKKVRLPNMRRYLQGPGACAFASVASVGNYYNKQITYDFVTQVLVPDGEGLFTADIALLLNKIGFTSVTIVTADLDQFDFSWSKLSRQKLIAELKRAGRYHSESWIRESMRQNRKFLETNPNNKILIDRRFGVFIRDSLDRGIPVLGSFNWNLFFNFPKWNERGEVDALRGDFESHEIVIYGYDEKGVDILDSHHELYKGKLKRYNRGRYRIDWETLMTVMGFGDLIIVDRYCKEITDELVSSVKNG